MANIILSKVRKYQYSSINKEKLVKNIWERGWLTDPPVYIRLLKESHNHTIPYPLIMATIFKINKKMDIRSKITDLRA